MWRKPRASHLQAENFYSGEGSGALPDSPGVPFPVGALLSVAIAAPVILLFRPSDFVLGCRLVGEQPLDGQEHLFGNAFLPLAPGYAYLDTVPGPRLWLGKWCI